jgi:hypothetical protein
MSLKKILNVLMVILLFIIAGCSSDDNEGVFDNQNTTANTGADASQGITESGVRGSVTGIQIIEPATIIAINGAGLLLSTKMNIDGTYSFSETLSGSYVLFLIPENQIGLDWNGNLQARIVLENIEKTLPDTLLVNETISTIGFNDSLDLNPIYTAVAKSIFVENKFDLFAFAKSVYEGTVNADLIAQYNTILVNTDEAKISNLLNSLTSKLGSLSYKKN